MTIPTESQEQITLFAWVNMNLKNYPQLDLLFHVPNGGLRNAREAAKLKKEGVRSGVPDLCLPVPSNGFHGLFIEMKRTQGGAISQEQKKWLAALEANGYMAVVCKGWEEARSVLVNYLYAKV